MALSIATQAASVGLGGLCAYLSFDSFRDAVQCVRVIHYVVTASSFSTKDGFVKNVLSPFPYNFVNSSFFFWRDTSKRICFFLATLSCSTFLSGCSLGYSAFLLIGRVQPLLTSLASPVMTIIAHLAFAILLRTNLDYFSHPNTFHPSYWWHDLAKGYFVAKTDTGEPIYTGKEVMERLIPYIKYFCSMFLLQNLCLSYLVYISAKVVWLQSSFPHILQIVVPIIGYLTGLYMEFRITKEREASCGGEEEPLPTPPDRQALSTDPASPARPQ